MNQDFGKLKYKSRTKETIDSEDFGKLKYKSNAKETMGGGVFISIVLIPLLAAVFCVLIIISPDFWGLFYDLFIPRWVSIVMLVVVLILWLIGAVNAGNKMLEIDAMFKPINVQVFENGVAIETKADENAEPHLLQVHFKDIQRITFDADIILETKTGEKVVLTKDTTKDFSQTSWWLKSQYEGVLDTIFMPINVHVFENGVTIETKADENAEPHLLHVHFKDIQRITFDTDIILETKTGEKAVLTEDTTKDFSQISWWLKFQYEVYKDVPMFGFLDTIGFIKSAKMKKFEEQHKVSKDKERYLLFGALLPMDSRQSPKVLKNRRDVLVTTVLSLLSVNGYKQRLLQTWGIKDKNDAIEILYDLSTAKLQTRRADKRLNVLADPSYRHDLFAGMLESDMDLDFADETFQTYIDYFEMSDIEFAETFAIYDSYQKIKTMLIEKLGITEQELASIKSLAAWDYGRVAFVARECLFVKYINETEAWEYIKKAAGNASELYNSWKEYYAAYVLGRVLGIGTESSHYYYELDYLLNSPESPLKEHEFK